LNPAQNSTTKVLVGIDVGIAVGRLVTGADVGCKVGIGFGVDSVVVSAEVEGNRTVIVAFMFA
jgi:hypothetical protein